MLYQINIKGITREPETQSGSNALQALEEWIEGNRPKLINGQKYKVSISPLGQGYTLKINIMGGM